MLYLLEANYRESVKKFDFTDKMPYDENGFIYEYHGTKREDFEDVISRMIDAQSGIGQPQGYVPETFYFLWDNDEIVGMFRFRHYLNPSLIQGSGHIGYYIAQEHRGKGYGTKGLKLLLEETRGSLREDEYYLRTNEDNIASCKVILNNGGYIHHTSGGKVFWRISRQESGS